MRIRPVVDREHPQVTELKEDEQYLIGSYNAEGIQRLYVFPNGYGASVITYQYYRSQTGWHGSAGGLAGLWELAILKFNRPNPDPRNEGLIYKSAVLGFIYKGFLTEVEYHQILRKIKRLPSHLMKRKGKKR